MDPAGLLEPGVCELRLDVAIHDGFTDEERPRALVLTCAAPSLARAVRIAKAGSEPIPVIAASIREH